MKSGKKMTKNGQNLNLTTINADFINISINGLRNLKRIENKDNLTSKMITCDPYWSIRNKKICLKTILPVNRG